MKRSIVTIGPNTEPVSMTEAKAALRIGPDDTTYDSEIARLNKAARQWVERRYGISLITQTRKQVQDKFYQYSPCVSRNYQNAIQLLYPPVQSIESFFYTDEAGVEQELVEDTNFGAAGLMTPVVGAEDIDVPRLYPINTWPLFKYIPDVVQITYVCGYGANGTFVPETIKQAIKMVLANFFEHRLEQETGERVQIVNLEMNVDRIMSTYEVFNHVGVND
jgi:uncharacterized phiE125 gp8 family phage protein